MTATAAPEAAPALDLTAQQQAVLTSLAHEARRQLPRLTAHAVKVITDQIGDYYGVRGVVLDDDLRTVIRASLAGMLDVLGGARSAGAEDLSVALFTGRRRAEQGVPLEAALQAFQLVGREMLSTLLACARARPPHELATFLGIATVAFDVVDTYSQAMVEGYRQAESLMDRLGSQQREAVLDALLDGAGAGPTDMAQSAALLGLPPHGPYALLLCTRDPVGPAATGAVRDICAAHHLSSVWCIRGDTELGVVALGRTSPSRLLEQMRPAVCGRLGLSSVFDSLRELPEAHRLAKLALRTVEPMGKGLAWIDERLVEAMVVASPDLSGRLAARALGGVLALRDPDRRLLLETLSAWYECDRSATLAAGRLNCHRNTVLNRLRRIEELIGVSLDHHSGLIACYIALVVLRLLPWEAAGEPPAVRA